MAVQEFELGAYDIQPTTASPPTLEHYSDIRAKYTLS
jgi:hypothetical protein